MLNRYNITLRYTLPGRSNPNWNELTGPIQQLVDDRNMDNYNWTAVSFTHPESQWFKEMYVTICGKLDYPSNPGSNEVKDLYSLLCDIYNISAPFNIDGTLWNNKDFYNPQAKFYKLFKGNDGSIRGDWANSSKPVANPARIMSYAWVVQRDGGYIHNFKYNQ